MATGKNIFVLMASLLLAVGLSGCTNPLTSGTQYKNDAVSIEEYYVSNTNPYAGSVTTISFLLQNNGEEPVPRVEVNFFDVYGMEVLELKCQGTQPVAGKNACIFDSTNSFGEIEPMDVRMVSITLKAPAAEEIKTSTKFTVGYYVNYSYSGFRKADIPIIDAVTLMEPNAEFSESTSTPGPIELTFDPPVGGTRIVEGKTISEYWGVQDRPFEVKMTFDYASGLTTEKSRDVIIKQGDIMLELKGPIERAHTDAGLLYCEFCKPGEEGCPATESSDCTSSNCLYSEKAVKIPSTLRCSFQSSGTNLPAEITASIWTSFSYTYEFTGTETFTVKPIPED